MEFVEKNSFYIVKEVVNWIKVVVLLGDSNLFVVLVVF